MWLFSFYRVEKAVHRERSVPIATLGSLCSCSQPRVGASEPFSEFTLLRVKGLRWPNDSSGCFSQLWLLDEGTSYVRSAKQRATLAVQCWRWDNLQVPPLVFFLTCFLPFLLRLPILFSLPRFSHASSCESQLSRCWAMEDMSSFSSNLLFCHMGKPTAHQHLRVCVAFTGVIHVQCF